MQTFKYITRFTQNEIYALFKRARSVYSDPFFYIKQARSLDKNGRILIITPKKIGNAPLRNKLRRRIKSIFFEKKLYNIPVNTIIFCKVGSAQKTYTEILELLESVIKAK